jgi:hypothetical protein
MVSQTKVHREIPGETRHKTQREIEGFQGLEILSQQQVKAKELALPLVPFEVHATPGRHRPKRSLASANVRPDLAAGKARRVSWGIDSVLSG